MTVRQYGNHEMPRLLFCAEALSIYSSACGSHRTRGVRPGYQKKEEEQLSNKILFGVCWDYHGLRTSCVREGSCSRNFGDTASPGFCSATGLCNPGRVRRRGLCSTETLLAGCYTTLYHACIACGGFSKHTQSLARQQCLDSIG